MPDSEYAKLGFDKLQEKVEGSPDSGGGRGSLEELKKRKAGLEDLKGELEKRAEFPTHEEIMEVKLEGKHELQLGISTELLRSALERAHISNLEDATLIRPEGVDLSQVPEDPEGNPQVFAKPLIRHVKTGVLGLGKAKGVHTGEAHVVVRLPNGGDDKSESTVVVAVVRHVNGVPQLDENNTATYRVMSEAEYTQTLYETRSDGKPSLNNWWIRGRLTNREYFDAYHREHGYGLPDYWDNWDRWVDADPRSRDEVLNERTDALLRRIEGSYVDLFVEVREKYAEVTSEIFKLQEEADRRRQEVTDLIEAAGILKQLNLSDSHTRAITLRMLEATYGFSGEQIDGLFRLLGAVRGDSRSQVPNRARASGRRGHY